MVEQLEQIQRLLRERQVSPAVQATLDWFSGGDPLTVARRLGEALQPVVDAGETKALQAYLTQIGAFVEPRVIEVIREPLVAGAKERSRWADKLPAVTQERLSRECREAVRLKDFDAAFNHARNLLALKVGQQTIQQRCVILGSILGSLENHQDLADKVWRRLKDNWIAWKLPVDLQQRVQEARKKRYEAAFARQAGLGELEFKRLLNELVMDLKSELPSRAKLGKPTEEEIDHFAHAVENLVDAGMRSPKQISLRDVMWALAEFTPRKQSATAKMIGLEERAHASLTPLGAQVAAAALGRLDVRNDFCGAVLQIAQDPPTPRYEEMALDLMGAIRWEGFVDFAHRMLGDKSDSAHHPSAIRVLGACGGEDTLQLLVETIEKLAKAKVIQGQERKTAIAGISAIGAIMRRLEIVDQRRSGLIVRLSKAIPGNDTDLNIALANLCLHRTEDLPDKIVDWAVNLFILGLWRPDKSAIPMSQMDLEDLKRRPLGHRQQYVQVLTHLSERALPVLHHFLTTERARVTGSYIAAAEVMGKLENPDSVEPLETMARNVRLCEQKALDKLEETIFDVEAGHVVPLRKDHLLGAIAEALKAIGTPAAIAALHGMKEDLAEGRLEGSGPALARVLSDLPPAPEGTRRRSRKDEDSDPAGGRVALDEGPEIEALVADLHGKGFLGFGAEKARIRRVSALRALAEKCAPSAIESMLACLGDKDPMVKASARTALMSYASPRQPQALQDMLANFACDELLDPDSKARDGLISLFCEIETEREPWASRIQAALTMDSEGGLRRAIAEVERATGMASSEELEESEFEKRLRLKHEYLQARRAWIANGKQGDPPEPPEELHESE